MTNYQEDIELLKDLINELNQVVRSVPCNLYWKDSNGVFKGCSDDVANALGLVAAEEIVGKSNKDLFDSPTAYLCSTNDTICLTENRQCVFEERYSTKSGFLVWHSIKKPLKDRQGNTVGLIGAAIDISKQKELESLLKIALDDAKTDIKAKELFIENLSHDVRTPLTGIINLIAELKKDKTHNKKNQGIIIILESSIKAFLNFFNDILATCEEVDNTGEVFKKSSVTVNEIFVDCVALFGSAIADKNLSICQKVAASSSGRFFLNREVLLRVLTNLVGNSIKFTHTGGITLSSYTTAESLVFVVEDTGIGIAKVDHERIFGRFYRIDVQDNKKYKGSGLGLFTVKKYLDAMNADISIESVVGEGSKFIIRIPLDNDINNTPTPNLQIKPTLDRSKIQNLGDKKILIVEDSFLAAFALSNILKDFSFKVDIAEDGAEARKKVRNNNYDMVFLDKDLPDVSGLDLLPDIRRISRYDKLPIILLSGSISKRLRSLANKIDCQEMVVKPMMADRMIEIINKYFAR